MKEGRESDLSLACSSAIHGGLAFTSIRHDIPYTLIPRILALVNDEYANTCPAYASVRFKIISPVIAPQNAGSSRAHARLGPQDPVQKTDYRHSNR